MNATIISKTTGNLTTIIIRRYNATKIMTVATSDAERTIKAWAIHLANLGYAVRS